MRQCMDESVASVYTFRLSIARAEDEAERKTLYFAWRGSQGKGEHGQVTGPREKASVLQCHRDSGENGKRKIDMERHEHRLRRNRGRTWLPSGVSCLQNWT